MKILCCLSFLLMAVLTLSAADKPEKLTPEEMIATIEFDVIVEYHEKGGPIYNATLTFEKPSGVRLTGIHVRDDAELVVRGGKLQSGDKVMFTGIYRELWKKAEYSTTGLKLSDLKGLKIIEKTKSPRGGGMRNSNKTVPKSPDEKFDKPADFEKPKQQKG